jgi:hypothetical protein
VAQNINHAAKFYHSGKNINILPTHVKTPNKLWPPLIIPVKDVILIKLTDFGQGVGMCI